MNLIGTNEHIYNKLQKYKTLLELQTKFENNKIVRLKPDEYKNIMEKNSFILLRLLKKSNLSIFSSVHINVTNIQELIKPPIGNSILEIMQKQLMRHLQREKYGIQFSAYKSPI